MATSHVASTSTSTYTPVATPSGQDPTLLPLPAASLQEAQDWSSVVLNYKIRLEHVALDIETDRLLYHLDCELDRPIPSTHLLYAEYVCLGWPLGGIWKIRSLGEEHRFLQCVAWRKTTMTRDEVVAMRDDFSATHDPSVDEDETRTTPKAVFDWTMQVGIWEGKNHWFARDIDIAKTSDSSQEIPSNSPLVMQLLADFTPIEVELVVNRIAAVDTVAQTFTASVTWTVRLCGITTIREDSVLHELLDLIDFKESMFEFTNITEIISERDLTSVLLPAGRVQYLDPLVPQQTIDKGLHHLQYSKRLNATFNEEMSLFYFPFDQQKLTFTFDMSRGVLPSMPITPAPVDPGTFAVQHFKLGNIFRVVYGDRAFVGDVIDTATTKCIRFEIMLERHSSYYLTNVVIPSAVITYLCFTTYAPLANEELMDTSSRLQIVTTLLLTDVTFKYNLATLLPQVSYFTSIDKYVYFCFLVAALVTVENAFYPLIVKHLPSLKSWDEGGLLGFSVGWFTIINVVWGLYLLYWVKVRAYKSQILAQVHEYVRVVQRSIPAQHREAVLRGYLAQLNYKLWALPTIMSTKRGSLFVQLPSDSPDQEKRYSRHEKKTGIFRKKALRDLLDIQKLYREIDPSASIPPVSSTGLSGVASTNNNTVVNVRDEAEARKNGQH